MRRILITGSRWWSDRQAVWNVLGREYRDAEAAGELPLVVVHGKCKTGADLHAHEWCETAWLTGCPGVDEDPHEAMWERPCTTGCYHRPRYRNGQPYCPLQGFYRNQKMVDLGAYRCHGFPLEKSPGTRDCMGRAERAGIEVVNHGSDEGTA